MSSNNIHPTAVIGPNVILGSGNQIGPYSVIHDGCTIGDDNIIGSHVVIGSAPEIRGWQEFTTPFPQLFPQAHGLGVRIGNRNVIKEFVAVQAGSEMPTSLRDDTFLMDKVHIAHDCEINSKATIACGTMLAGHVSVQVGANLGLNVSVHQFRCVGIGAMVGMGAVVATDIPPLAVATGIPARVRRLNSVLLKRLGFAEDVISTIEASYSIESPNLESFVLQTATDRLLSQD